MGDAMKQGMQLMDLGASAIAVTILVEKAVTAPRDLTRAEAAILVRHTLQMQCAALEVERLALEIPDKPRG
jgi:acyl-CoA hydrolase